MPVNANAVTDDDRLGVGAQDPQSEPHAKACNISAQTAPIVPEPEHTLGAAKNTQGLIFMLKGFFDGNRCTVLFDTGASTSFVHKRSHVDSGGLKKIQEKMVTQCSRSSHCPKAWACK